MQWSDIQFHPPSKTLRQFAWMWLACFGGLAAWEGIVREHTNLAANLRGLDGPGFSDRLDDFADHPGAHVLWAVHPDRPDLPDHRSRPAASCPPTGLGVILVSQDNPRRPAALFQAVLTLTYSCHSLRVMRQP